MKVKQLVYSLLVYGFVYGISGCATQSKSLPKSSGIPDPGKEGEYRTRNVIIGSAFKNKPGTAPSLSNPKVEARWVESKIIGNRFIDGHFEYLILEPTRWDVTE